MDFPCLKRQFCVRSLGNFPTPVQSEPAIARQFGIGELWVKRDDIAGRYGGNKVRKLEFALAEALAKGASRIVTIGPLGSNHVAATSLYARELGISVRAVLFAQPMHGYVLDNLLVAHTAGAELMFAAAVRDAIRLFYLARDRSEFALAAGGSSATGVLGYVDAALELKAQIDRGELPVPDAIFLPLGTCGTVAGLWLGMKLARIPTHIIAVRVVNAVVANIWNIRRLVWQASRLLRRCGIYPPKVPGPRLTIDGAQFGPGYAISTPQGEQAISDFKHLVLDPTYTAKTAAALLKTAGTRKLSGQKVLLWHTGNSQPLQGLIRPGAGPSDLAPELRRQLAAGCDTSPGHRC